MKTTIRVSTLKASVVCAARKDIRCYLNGVLLAFRHGAVNRVEVVSSDGHVMSAFSEPLDYTDGAQTANFDIIVPLSALTLALKGAGKRDVLVFESLPDGRYALGDTIFSPVDGKYPDYRRAIRQETQPEDHVQCNPDLLAKGLDCLRLFYGSKVTPMQTPTSRGIIMHCGRNDAVVAVADWRAFGTYQGFYEVEASL